MRTIDRLYSFIAISIVVACCCSLVRGWVPLFGRTWIWTLSLALFSLLIYNRGLKLKFIFPLFLYGIVLYLNMYSGDEKFNFIATTMELFGFISASIVFYIFSQPRFQRAGKTLIICFISTLVITFVGTLSIYMKEPEVLRMIQEGMNEGDGRLFLFYAKMGVESYAMGHALPVFIPIIICAIKKTDILRNKVFLFLFLVVILALVYMSTATTALLLAMVLIIVSFVWDEKSRAKNVLSLSLCFLVAITFITNRELLSSVLSSINLDSETTYAGKVSDFQDYATYGSAGGQTEFRLNLYNQSLDVFFSSPIIGHNDAKIGGHSIFLDRMAMLGLVGFIPLVMFLFYYFRYVLRKLSVSIRLYCVLGFLYFVILGCLKNIFSFEYILLTLLIMPLACLCLDRTLIDRSHFSLDNVHRKL